MNGKNQVLASLSVLLFLGLPSVAQAAKRLKIPPFEIIEKKGQGEDKIFRHQWYLEPTGITKAWDTTIGDSSVVIAVVDSGIDYTYSDLSNSIWINENEVQNNKKDDDGNRFVDDIIGWNFTDKKSLPYDDNGHGTFIAGIIGAEHNNGLGGKGVCPNCKIMSLRFLDADGMGDDEDSYKAIRYAIENGASIINLSFAGEGYDATIAKLIDKGAEKGILFVVAAGNDSDSNDIESTYPANFKKTNLITVGASDNKGGWWWKSNYSPTKVHVAIPGHEIWGPWNDKKWYKGSGTSFAAPIVSAIAGLMKSVNPKITPEQMKNILIKTSVKTKGFEDKVYSGGIIDAEAAVLCAKDPSHSCLL